MKSLKGKKIVLGVSGSIAAYKSALIVRLLVREGALVKVVMTPPAKDFITPLTLSTLSGNPALSGLSENDSWNNHVLLGRWADLMLIAPASANTLAKMAGGICDNLLLAVYLSAACPVWLAPAMDEDMWLHPATQKNIHTLQSFGHRLLPVEEGELASGLQGQGRMAEPEAIVAEVKNFFLRDRRSLGGKQALVTAGPTYEPLDPVRFIGNYSSGKMGMAIAEELAARGASVELVLGPSNLPAPTAAGLKITHVKTAAEMEQACLLHFPNSSIAVLAAAVADFRPAHPADQKIKKQEAGLEIRLEKTPDILKTLGSMKKPSQLLVGFALETDHEEANAVKKMKEKNTDIIVLNSLKDPGAGFIYDTNKVTLFTRNGRPRPFPLKPKREAARDIVDAIIELQHA